MLLRDAVATQLGVVLRALSPAPPWDSDPTEVLRVCMRGDELPLVPAGSRVLLRVRSQDADWLNLARPVLAQQRLRVVLWADEGTLDSLQHQAVDLLDWVSRSVAVPPRRWPRFAEQGMRAALDAGVPFAWDGEQADLEALLGSVGWSGDLVELRAAMSFREMLRMLDAPGLPIVMGMERDIDPWRVRMALARTKREGTWVALRPSKIPPGMWRLHAQQADWDVATAKLGESGWERAGAMAAWVDLEPERIDEAGARVGQPPVDPTQWPAERVAVGDGPMHVLRARIGDADVVAARDELRAGPAPVDDAGIALWSEGAEPWRDEPQGPIEARLVRYLRYLGDAVPQPGSVETAAGMGLTDVAAELGRIRFERGLEPRPVKIVEWLTQYGEVELALRIAQAWSGQADAADDRAGLYMAKVWLGNLYAGLGEVEQARLSYEASLVSARELAEQGVGLSGLDPALPNPYDRLADLYHALGHEERAQDVREEGWEAARTLVERTRKANVRENVSDNAKSPLRSPGFPPVVFISYSHDSNAHQQRVLALADRLHEDGVDARLERYVEIPPEMWRRWVERQIVESTYVLIVCTPSYRERFDRVGSDLSEKERSWEATLASAILDEAVVHNDKLIPVLFEEGREQDVPLVLRVYTRYRLPQEYERLYRRLTGQPSTPAPPVGTIRSMPPAPKPTLRGEMARGTSQRGVPATAITADVLVDELARLVSDPELARVVVLKAGFSPGHLPAFRIPLVFWTTVVDDARHGAIAGGMQAVAEAAARLFPGNPVLGSYRSQRDGSEAYELPGAQRYHEEGVAIAKGLVAREPGRSDRRRDLYVSQEKLGDLQSAAGNVERARQAYEESLEMVQTLVAREPDRSELQRDVWSLLNKLGDLHVAQGSGEQARRYYEDGLSITQVLVEREPGRVDLQRELAVSHEKLGSFHLAAGNAASARQLYQRELAIRKALVEREPGREDLQHELALAYDRLAKIEVEGSRGKLPFSLDERPYVGERSFLTYASDGAAWIWAGRLHGLSEGDRVEVQQPTHEGHEVVATARLVKVFDDSSQLELDPDADESRPRSGSMVVPRTLALRKTVRLAPSAVRVVGLVAGLTGSLRLAPVDEDQPSDFVVALVDGKLHVSGPAWLRRVPRPATLDGAAEVVADLEALARSEILLAALESSEASSTVHWEVEAFVTEPKDESPRRLVSNETVPEGSRIYVELRSPTRGSHTLYVNVLDRGVARRIELVNRSEPAGIQLVGSNVRWIGRRPHGGPPGMRLDWPKIVPKGEGGHEELIVVASERPLDLRSLIDEPRKAERDAESGMWRSTARDGLGTPLRHAMRRVGFRVGA